MTVKKIENGEVVFMDGSKKTLAEYKQSSEYIDARQKVEKEKIDWKTGKVKEKKQVLESNKKAALQLKEKYSDLIGKLEDAKSKRNKDQINKISSEIESIIAQAKDLNVQLEEDEKLIKEINNA